MPPPTRLPGVPRLAPGFLQRLQDAATQRIRNEYREKLPDAGDTSVPKKEEVAPGLLTRIKRKILDQYGDLTGAEERLLDPNIKVDIPLIKYRIRFAGQRRLLLWMYYNDQWRFVEPYSYRYETPSGSNTKMIYFYGYCRIHDRIHKFRLDRIQGLRVLDETFAPRWPIEVA